VRTWPLRLNGIVKCVTQAYLLSASLLLASCAKGLDTHATVRLSTQTEDESLSRAASRLSGLTLSQDLTPEYWSSALKKDRAGPNPRDLYVAEWGRELVAAQKDGGLAQLAAYWPRTAASRRMPLFAASIRPAPKQGFIPTEVSLWGLFYNRALFAELGSPEIRDMDGLTALLDAAKRMGIVPIALGAAFGWPGAAWFTCIDMRLNGGKAAWERVMGDRPFDDAESLAAAKLLATWRDAGYFSPDAPQAGMEESVSAVENGKALLVLMDSSAVERTASRPAVGFMEMPFWKGRSEPRGEMGSVTGFVVSASSPSPGAALALVDAYIAAGSVRESAKRYALPVRFGRDDSDTLQGVQARALEKTLWLVPSQDRIMPAQFVQDSIKVWSAFFDRTMGTDGAGLASALQALNAKTGVGAAAGEAGKGAGQ
jgi:ABC-type glycerol-3-phosphate transport system substrate-binding protein